MQKEITMAPPIRSITATAAALLLVIGAHAAENAPCYFPGEVHALGYYPCQPFGAEISLCCPQGWTCFSNALCIATTETKSFPNITLGEVQRGACTSPGWNNALCGGVCLTGDNIYGKLAACTQETFCCEDDYKKGKCTCEEGGGSFEIKRGMGSKIIEVDSETFFGTATVIIAEPVTSFVSDATTTTGTATSTGESSVSNTADGATTTPTSTEPAEVVEGGGGLSKGATIGIGVGAGVAGLLILGALAFFVMRWRRKNSQMIGTNNGGKVTEDPIESHQYGVTYGRAYGEQP
ncbi:hypothetical protein QC763_406590 [Podospora pseudopauciseta]|uniref:Mid2 domain-containing protein n=2 Tax=Podospora TaxID=5144 RepID=A0ABR0HDL3_9PEZI|nr:hypothetical protein QC763_406590 [Podospora pseudopauciseta]KAK4677302.1 hypothetical protein QC764_406590 [Podospora pseudoanserina]